MVMCRASRRLVVRKMGLKRLAKGRIAHMCKPKMGKPVGGYHVFARTQSRLESDPATSGIEKLAGIQQAWLALAPEVIADFEVQAAEDWPPCIISYITPPTN
jgi:hypothetical protein